MRKYQIPVLLALFTSISVGLYSNTQYSVYIKYAQIVKSKNEISMVTLSEEIVDLESQNYIRVSYSAEHNLVVQFRGNNDCGYWNATYNHLQKLRGKNVFELYDIPKTYEEAFLNDYTLIKKNSGNREFSKQTSDIHARLTFFHDGRIKIGKVKKKSPSGRYVELVPLKMIYGLGNLDQKLKKELFMFKEHAQKGEKNISKALKKYRQHMKIYSDIILRKICEIQSHFKDYYLGIVDYGIKIIALEENLQKGEGFLKQAISFNKRRGEAYGLLLFIYQKMNKNAEYQELKEKMDKELNEDNKFIAYEMLISHLSTAGSKKEARKIFVSMRKNFKKERFKIALKKLKKIYGI